MNIHLVAIVSAQPGRPESAQVCDWQHAKRPCLHMPAHVCSTDKIIPPDFQPVMAMPYIGHTKGMVPVRIQLSRRSAFFRRLQLRASVSLLPSQKKVPLSCLPAPSLLNGANYICARSLPLVQSFIILQFSSFGHNHV